MLFGTANTPGSSGSNPNVRPTQPPYGYYPSPNFQQHYDPNQNHYGYFMNPSFQQPPSFQQQPFPQQPHPQPEQTDEAPTQRSGKKVASSPKKRSHLKKMDGSKKSCNKRAWAPNEEAWLATCYCDASEDSQVGNSQKRGTFWGTVEEKFNANNYGWVRGADQLSSKWRALDRNCKNFTGCYESVSRAWGSGRDHEMIYDQALSDYYDNYTKTFTSKEAWMFLKNHPKWMPPKPVGGTGLRDEEEDFFDHSVDLSTDRENELFGADPIPRPMGRNRARKVARSSGSSDAATSSRTGTPTEKVDDAIQAMARHKAELLAAQKASIEEITRQERLRTAFQGLQFLKFNPEDIQDPADRAAFEKMKKKFRNEFAEFYEADEEDEDDDE